VRSSATVIAAAVVFGTLVVASSAATAAHAAGSIGVSDDGVTFGASYPGSLFDSIAHLVPMDSDSESFYIRNDTTEAAFLRIVLRDVTYSDAAYGAALSLSASTSARTGTPTPLTSATPCVVLVEGQTVQPGQVVPISAVLALGNLDGSAGQNATAAMTMRIELHDTSTGSLPVTACTTTPTAPGTDVIVVPRPRPGTGQNGASPTSPDIETGVQAPDGETIGEFPGENQSSVDPNTWLLYEERWWFVMLLAFVVGSLCFMIVDWRRQRRIRQDETGTGA